MKVKYFSIIALLVIVILSGCRKDKDLKPHTLGSIQAGETGLGIRNVEDPSPFEWNTNGGYTKILTDSSDTIAAEFKIVYQEYHYSNNDYYSSFIENYSPRIEFVVEMSNDTIWHCDEWSPDSLTHHTQVYNRENKYNCTGTEILSSTNPWYFPKAFKLGDEIGPDANWQTFLSTITFHNISRQTTVYNQTSHITDTETILGKLWSSGTSYIAFRVFIGNGKYRYGYVELQGLGLGVVKVIRYAVEI